MIEQFEATRADAVIALEEVAPEEVVHYGIAQPRDGQGAAVFELADLIEKPPVDEAPSNLAIAARYVFSPVVFDYLHRTPPGKGDEIQLTDAIRLMLEDGRTVLGARLPTEESRFDIGNFDAYFQAFVEFALADPASGEALRRRLEQLLDKTAGDPPCS